MLEALPPFADRGIHLAAFAAQPQKVVAGAEAQVPEQPVRTLAGALQEARLQRPDFLHVGGETVRDGELLRLCPHHVIHRPVQRGDRRFAFVLEPLPRREHFVPQQCREQESRRDRLARKDALIGVLECKHDEALAERLLHDDVEQRQQAVVQPLPAQLHYALHRVTGEQELQHLVEQARWRHVGEQVREPAYRPAGPGIDLEPAARREPHRAQHAHRIFAEAALGIADHAQPPFSQIGHPVVVIPDLLRGRVVEQRVDAEIAARGVLLLAAEHVVAQDAPVLVRDPLVALVRRAGAAESGHLHRFRPAHHVHQAKAPPDHARAAEQPPHFLRRGIGRHVEVLGPSPEQ